jgi:hypothetical protein
MKIETDGPFAAYKERLSVAEEVSEALLEGMGGIQHAWFEQSREVLDAQLNLLQAATALRDPQQLLSVQAAVLTRPPKDLLELQRRFLAIATETQTKISVALGKHMARLKTETAPSLVANTERDVAGPTEMLYSGWNRMLQNAAQFASLGAKAFPPSVSSARDFSAGKNEISHAKRNRRPTNHG